MPRVARNRRRRTNTAAATPTSSQRQVPKLLCKIMQTGRVTARSASAFISTKSLADILEPAIDVLFGFVFRAAVALLKTAGEFGALAFNHAKVIVGELAPLLLNLTFDLLPVTFHAIPVHERSPLRWGKSPQRPGGEWNRSAIICELSTLIWGAFFVRSHLWNSSPDGALSRHNVHAL